MLNCLTYFFKMYISQTYLKLSSMKLKVYPTSIKLTSIRFHLHLVASVPLSVCVSTLLLLLLVGSKSPPAAVKQSAIADWICLAIETSVHPSTLW